MSKEINIVVAKAEIKQKEGLEYAKKEAIRRDGSETADTAMWRERVFQSPKVILSRTGAYCIIYCKSRRKK